MRGLWYVCLLIYIMSSISVAEINAGNHLFKILSKKNDPRVTYQKHIDGIREYMDTFHIENIEFPVKKNLQSTETFVRKGFLAVRPEFIGTIVICHGYTQSKNDIFFLRTLFPQFNVLAFDFRAHGEMTDGQYSTIGRDEVNDVYGAVEFIKSREDLSQKPIIGFGFSMGAVSLLQAQAHFKNLFDVLIVDSPFDSSSDCMARGIEKILTINILGRKYRLPGKKLIMKCLYNKHFQPVMQYIFRWVSGINPNVARTRFVPVVPIDSAPEIKIPCLFITCEKDTKVSVDCVRRLYDAVDAPYKRLWITHGVKHCGSCLYEPERYEYRIHNFINNALNKSWKDAAKIRDDRAIIQAA